MVIYESCEITVSQSSHFQVVIVTVTQWMCHNFMRQILRLRLAHTCWMGSSWGKQCFAQVAELCIELHEVLNTIEVCLE